MLHIFVLKFRAPCWKLPSVSLDCVMSFIYIFFFFFFFLPKKVLEKKCLRNWKDLVVFMPTTALLSWVQVGSSPMQRLSDHPSISSMLWVHVPARSKDELTFPNVSLKNTIFCIFFFSTGPSGG